MNRLAIVSEASRMGLDVVYESPGDGIIRYTLGNRDPLTGAFYDIYHGFAYDVRAFLRGYEACHKKMFVLKDALTLIANQCGPYATVKPALDYATIGNIARFAITDKRVKA